MKTTGRLILLIPAFTLLQLTAGCTDKKETPKSAGKDYSTQVVSPLPDDQIVLEYDGGRILVSEVKQTVNPEFEKARETILNTYIRAAEDLLLEREAKSPDAVAVTKAEAEAYMKANKVTQSSVEEIRQFLIGEKKRVQGQVAKHEVFKKLNVKNKLGAARYDVTKTQGMPALGPEGAKVTIQIFCDLMSPLCSRSRIHIQQITTANPEQVRFVYRAFPIPSHPHSREAALYGVCAHEQGAFWKVHDRFFEQQRDLNPEKMGKLAKDLGLDMADLQTCLKSTEAAQTLQKDLDEAKALGLNQAPTYFINGIKVTDPEVLYSTTQAEVSAAR